MPSDATRPDWDAAAYTLAASPFALLSVLSTAVVAVELVGDVAVGLAIVAGLVGLVTAVTLLVRVVRPHVGSFRSLPRFRENQT